MVLEIGLLAEPAVADVALEGPRARVHVRVRLEVARRRERLGAHRALVRLLLIMKRMKLCHPSKLFQDARVSHMSQETFISRE